MPCPHPPGFRAEAMRLARGGEPLIPDTALGLGISEHVSSSPVPHGDVDGGREDGRPRCRQEREIAKKPRPSRLATPIRATAAPISEPPSARSRGSITPAELRNDGTGVGHEARRRLMRGLGLEGAYRRKYAASPSLMGTPRGRLR